MRILLFLAIFISLSGTLSAAERELTIVYTGGANAQLYPCKCPKNPDGGVARRASVLRELRKDYPDMLLLEAGSAFAGGIYDEEKAGEEIDKLRTSVYLTALESMEYDAAVIGKEAFKFGEDFLKRMFKEKKLDFISDETEKFSFKEAAPYMIKKAGGLKVGIVGVMSEEVIKKAGKKADIIILIVRMKEQELRESLEKTEGIDVVILEDKASKMEGIERIKETIVVRAYPSAKKVGVLNLMVDKKGRVTSESLFLRDLDKSVEDDEGIAELLEVYKEEKKEIVQELNRNAPQIPLTVVKSEKCLSCDDTGVLGRLRKLLPTLSVRYLEESSDEAQKLLEELNISQLPLYVIGEEIGRAGAFEELKKMLVLRNGRYLVIPMPQDSFFHFKREKIGKKVNLFVASHSQDGIKAEKMIYTLMREHPDERIDFSLHFIVGENEKGFVSFKGKAELEENLRQACIMKYYPAGAWNYILNRGKDIESTWWEDWAYSSGIDPRLIWYCAKGGEGIELLRSDIELGKGIGVRVSPTFLIDNQEMVMTLDKELLERSLFGEKE